MRIGRSGRAAGIEDGVVDAVVRPAMVGSTGPDELGDDHQAVLESADLVVRRVAEGNVLRVVPATADTQDQPAAADVIEGRGHLGQEGRVAVLGGHDQDPELGPGRDRGRRGQHGPGLVDARRLAIEAEQQVVVDPDRVEAGGLRCHGHVADLRPIGRRRLAVLLGDGQHDTEPDHGILLV